MYRESGASDTDIATDTEIINWILARCVLNYAVNARILADRYNITERKGRELIADYHKHIGVKD